MFGNQADPAFLGYYEKLMTGKLDGFERLLKKQKYLAGDVRIFFSLFFVEGTDRLWTGNICR